MTGSLPRLLRYLLFALCVALAGVAAGSGVAHADDHRGHEFRGHEFHGDRRFHGGPSFGLFFGAPALVPPPPLVGPAYPYATYPYPYAPVPISGVYMTAYGYCRDFRTAAGVETACQQPDGLWRFIN